MTAITLEPKEQSAISYALGVCYEAVAEYDKYQRLTLDALLLAVNRASIPYHLARPLFAWLSLYVETFEIGVAVYGEMELRDRQACDLSAQMLGRLIPLVRMK